MIVGGGLIANAFRKQNFDENLIVFASGVSNSKKLTSDDCERELNLLKECISGNSDNKTFLYFSTYSIDNPLEKDSPYVQHKLSAENFIRNNSKKYLVVRTGNVVGKSGNINTVFNFMFQKIKNSEEFDLWIHAKRNLLDVDHLVMMVGELIKDGYSNEIVYLLNPVDIHITDLLKKIESFLHKKAVYKEIDKVSAVVGADKTLSVKLFNRLGISSEGYADKLISKYGDNGKV